MKVYVVTMYRWGNRERHSYVHGVYQSKETAVNKGEEEQVNRGHNKYLPEVLEFDLGTEECKIIQDVRRANE